VGWASDVGGGSRANQQFRVNPHVSWLMFPAPEPCRAPAMIDDKHHRTHRASWIENASPYE
jgi:hypothetical protein